MAVNDRNKIFKTAKNLKTHNEHLRKCYPNHLYVCMFLNTYQQFLRTKNHVLDLSRQPDEINKILRGKPLEENIVCLFINGVK